MIQQPPISLTAMTNSATTLPGPSGKNWKGQANWQIKKLRRHRVDVVTVPINEEAQDRPSEEIEKEMHLANEFKEQWNDMPD